MERYPTLIDEIIKEANEACQNPPKPEKKDKKLEILVIDRLPRKKGRKRKVPEDEAAPKPKKKTKKQVEKEKELAYYQNIPIVEKKQEDVVKSVVSSKNPSILEDYIQKGITKTTDSNFKELFYGEVKPNPAALQSTIGYTNFEEYSRLLNESKDDLEYGSYLTKQITKLLDDHGVEQYSDITDDKRKFTTVPNVSLNWMKLKFQIARPAKLYIPLYCRLYLVLKRILKFHMWGDWESPMSIDLPGFTLNWDNLVENFPALENTSRILAVYDAIRRIEENKPVLTISGNALIATKPEDLQRTEPNPTEGYQFTSLE